MIMQLLILFLLLLPFHGDCRVNPQSKRLYSASASPGPIVDTVDGKIQGIYTESAKVFRSIPYASPPVDSLRWQSPLPHKPWSGILQTTADPPGCPQLMPCILPKEACPTKVSEDCLFLNVFTPLNAQSSSKLPVMVFIHGGSFLVGYGGGHLYDGQYIVNNTNVILVSINYRLGALGFLLYGEGSGAVKGNYGFQDQQLALQWVQQNIVQFGGDLAAVTIFGQSAGAVSVALHMASNHSKGLFSKAILESEPFSISIEDAADAKKLGENFAKELGCTIDDTSCVRGKPLPDIIAAEMAILKKTVDFSRGTWTPWVDGDEIPNNPLQSFTDGDLAAPVPMMIGTVAEEGVFSIYDVFTSSMRDLEYDALVVAQFPLHFVKILKEYPPLSSSGDQRPQASVLYTDYSYACSTRNATLAYLKTTQPVWLYMFEHPMSFDGWGANFSYCNGHSCHGVELTYVFHTATLDGFHYTPDELVLSDTLINYWTNFARYGNPNGKGEPTARGIGKLNPQVLSWPDYTLATQPFLHFKTPRSEVGHFYNKEHCDFWDTIGYNN